MRIAHLTPSAQLGGAQRVLLDCIRATPAADVAVISLGEGPLLDFARAAGAAARVLTPPRGISAAGDAFASPGQVGVTLLGALPALPAFVRRLRDAVAEFQPDIVHSHGIKTHVLTALVPRHPAVIWHLHDYAGGRSVSSKLLAALGHRCSLAIAVSESVARDARIVLPASVPIDVIHNAVDLCRFRPDGPVLDLDSLAGAPPAPQGTLRVGLPATFARWKGHDVFLHAVSKLDRRAVRAYVIGGPLYETQNSQWSRAELDEMVRRLGLDGTVFFTGPIDDMPGAYRALDIVVHASTRPEPFGLVIAEAMACGRPLVVAPLGGASELFVDGRHARSAYGPDALAAVIGGLMFDAPRRQAMGRASRLHAESAFGMDRFAGELTAAVATVLSTPAALEAV